MERIDYLLGFWIKDTTKKSEGKYKYFFANNIAEEEKIWKTAEKDVTALVQEYLKKGDVYLDVINLPQDN